MVAHAMDPAGEPDRRSDLLSCQVAASVGAIKVHRFKRRKVIGRIAPEQRMGRGALSRRATAAEQSGSVNVYGSTAHRGRPLMAKIFTSIPVRTRLPVEAWALAG